MFQSLRNSTEMSELYCGSVNFLQSFLPENRQKISVLIIDMVVWSVELRKLCSAEKFKLGFLALEVMINPWSNSASEHARDLVLVSNPMFMGLGNHMEPFFRSIRLS